MYFCLNKLTFVATNACLLRQNASFVAPKLLLQQTCVCHDKHLSQQKFSCDKKYFVTAVIVLSCQAYFCRDKRHVATNVFVATEMILVAAPTNDSLQHYTGRPVVAVSLATQLPCAFYFSFAMFATPHLEISSGSELGHPLHVTITLGGGGGGCKLECVYVHEFACVCVCVSFLWLVHRQKMITCSLCVSKWQPFLCFEVWLKPSMNQKVFISQFVA